MARTYTTQMAGIMRSYLERNPACVLNELQADGLLIIAQRDAEHWRLTLAREDRPPSEQEMAAVAKAFKAPADPEPARRRRRRPHPVSGRPGQWHEAEYAWREREP